MNQNLSNICLIISTISILLFIISYHFRVVSMMGISAGMLIVSMFMHLLINPIDSDDGLQEGEEDGNLQQFGKRSNDCNNSYTKV